MQPIDLTFDGTDNGNCRVYYRHDRRLYCFQIADYRAKTFHLLSCSRDGEPSCPVRIECFREIEAPQGDESTARELREFLARPNWRVEAYGG